MTDPCPAVIEPSRKQGGGEEPVAIVHPSSPGELVAPDHESGEVEPPPLPGPEPFLVDLVEPVGAEAADGGGGDVTVLEARRVQIGCRLDPCRDPLEAVRRG